MLKSKINNDFNIKIIYNNKKLKFLGVFFNKKERIDKMNKFLKRVISAFMAFAVMLSMIVLSGTPKNNISAATTQSGTCGNNLTWTFDGSGTLTINAQELWKIMLQTSALPPLPGPAVTLLPL